MKIRSVESRVVEIPFSDGGRGEGITPTTWRTLETVLIRIEDTDGNVGWGEAFAYFIADAAASVVERLLKPMLEGTTIESIAQWNHRVQQQLHLFGRYGVTMFAISGVDTALWDLAAKRSKMPLHAFMSDGGRISMPTYASLVRYADVDIAPRICEKALDEGFASIKLHEIDIRYVEACHRVVDGRAPISVDVNCSWDVAIARENVERLAQLGGIEWLEEPVFPPEDFATLSSLRTPRLPLAAGENWCTAFQFSQAMQQGAVDYVQPSVSKVGGVTEFIDIVEEAMRRGVGVLPHSPYFGPGFLATLHLAAAYPSIMQIEYLYVEPDAELIDLSTIRSGPVFTLDDAPGIGLSPDEAVVTRFVRAR